MNLAKLFTSGLLLGLFVATCPVLARATELPEAPQAQSPTATTASEAAPPGEFNGTAQVQGSVKDVQGNPVPKASVTLSASGILGDRTTTSGEDGSFSFTSVAAGQYRLRISAPGLERYTSPEFNLRAGEAVTRPPIALNLSTSTTVDVVATTDEIATAQVHEEEKQRVFGVFPNFYTSYIWKAAPMPANQKYKLALRTSVDPLQFLLVAGLAGAEQYEGTFPGYGPGIEGYGKRFGAALADSTVSHLVGYALLPAVLHQDPRYFYLGSGGWRKRTIHAVASTFITRGDNGKTEPNYSHLLGNLAAGGVSNLYHPASSRGLGPTFQTFGITIAGNIGGNLFREFVLRGFVPNLPTFANGKAAGSHP